MGEHQDFLEEEGGQQNQPLIKFLRNVYQSGPEDARSLARMRERLLSGDYQQAYTQQETLSDYNQKKYSKRINKMNNHVSAPTTARLHPWNHTLVAIAAVFTTFVVIGSLILALNLAHRPTSGTVVIPRTSTAATTPGSTAIPATTLTATTIPLPTVTSTPVLPHTPTDVQNIQMIDSSIGWIFCGDGSVLHTTDGGLNWVDVTPAALFGYKNHGGVKSLFLDGSTAWIVILTDSADNTSFTSYSFHTIDAGKNWQEGILRTNEPTVTAAPLFSVTVVSPQEAWAMEIRVEGASANSGALYGMNALCHTTDGGKTWIQIQSVPHVAQYRYPPAISFADQRTGIITGSLTIPSTTQTEIVYLTQDSGASWHSVSVQSPEHLQWTFDAIFSPQFLTAKDGVFTASFQSTVSLQSNPVQNRKGFSVFSTHDGGQTWSSSPIVNYNATPNIGVLDTNFFDTLHGYVLSGQVGMLQLYITSDGGQHWALSPLNMPDLKPSGQIGLPDFISLNTAWTLTAYLPGSASSYPTSLYTTVDGGKTWTQVHSHFPSFITPKSAY